MIFSCLSFIISNCQVLMAPEYGWIPEWPKGADCKSVANCFGGSNPPPPIIIFKAAYLRAAFFLSRASFRGKSFFGTSVFCCGPVYLQWLPFDVPILQIPVRDWPVHSPACHTMPAAGMLFRIIFPMRQKKSFHSGIMHFYCNRR